MCQDIKQYSEVNRRFFSESLYDELRVCFVKFYISLRKKSPLTEKQIEELALIFVNIALKEFHKEYYRIGLFVNQSDVSLKFIGWLFAHFKSTIRRLEFETSSALRNLSTIEGLHPHIKYFIGANDKQVSKFQRIYTPEFTKKQCIDYGRSYIRRRSRRFAITEEHVIRLVSSLIIVRQAVIDGIFKSLIREWLVFSKCVDCLPFHGSLCDIFSSFQDDIEIPHLHAHCNCHQVFLNG